MAAISYKNAKALCFLMFISFAFVSTTKKFPSFQHPTNNDGSLSFLVLGDWGRRGGFNQSQVALQMGRIAEKLDINFVVSSW